MQRKARSLIRWRFIKKSAGALMIIIVLSGLLTVLLTATANATPEAKPPLDCLSCHSETLEFHDNLGSGNKACWVCHDNTDMKMLRLADETPLPLSDSPQLCAQCHQKRYNAWKEGTHGIPGTVAAVKCTSCHDPHQPQIVLSDITKPHPMPIPPPPSSPFKAWMLGAFLLFLLIIALVIVRVRKGEGP